MSDLSDDEYENRLLREGIDPDTAAQMVRDRDRVEDPDEYVEDPT